MGREQTARLYEDRASDLTFDGWKQIADVFYIDDERDDLDSAWLYRVEEESADELDALIDAVYERMNEVAREYGTAFDRYDTSGVTNIVEEDFGPVVMVLQNEVMPSGLSNTGAFLYCDGDVPVEEQQAYTAVLEELGFERPIRPVEIA